MVKNVVTQKISSLINCWEVTKNSRESPVIKRSPSGSDKKIHHGLEIAGFGATISAPHMVSSWVAGVHMMNSRLQAV